MSIFYTSHLPDEDLRKLKKTVQKTVAQWGYLVREKEHESDQLGELEIYRPEQVIRLRDDQEQQVRRALGLLSEFVSID